ncbi:MULTISPECIES: DUF262 domain-containing protein [Bacilli]|uniref:DUF262 domain-containing protein n=2 Tax=Listeria monocytogenes TaxID=1639 RepID=A0A6W8C061_LISMN|nr:MULTISPECIES: DUF262 domain-containing protein [Bacilli]EAD3756997.1 DUF262 domain-containing protein [Listeria monocytogenes]EAD3757941.1 DUF262 domain-containing protein [Listeria monocytogenes]EAE3064844.1 DUF262 domain-containing protein [Listeria monocytogenes]EAE4101644.1 DUF262 domain-containing protein [Listeria monocytogenes]EAE4104517.1 DUF262 domain-containing protein [Listeria monocytogenes]
MSKLVDESITIYEALKNIEQGKYVMPAFQRQYVWSMEQIEKLWDSILLDYPISTFLFWHVDNSNILHDTYFCSFLSDVTFDSRKQSDSPNYDLTSIDTYYTDTAILDGQQRFTSLYLSLMGQAGIRKKYARKNAERTLSELLIELNKNKVETNEEEYNSKKFDVKFTDKIGRISPTQFKMRDILKEEFQNKESREAEIEKNISNVPLDSKEYARNILTKLCSKIYEEKLIRYTEIYEMNQDDALEMFVRFNSGGRPLRKSEITMSILEAYWPSAREQFGKTLVRSYENFGTDFIIRTALMLYGDVIKSNITREIAESLKNDWNKFKQTLVDLEELLNEMKLDVTRYSSGWNVLLPIIYYIYYTQEYKENKKAIKAYLIRAIVFTYFQSGTTAKLQQMKTNINEFNYEITMEMLDQMNELRVTDGKIEDILNEEKGSRVAGEVLYYLGLDWTNKHFKYELDHLHPFARFDTNKPPQVTIEKWKLWRGMRNRLPNLHLLEGRSNASKSDMRLIDYYNDMNEVQKQAFMEQATIPKDVSLDFEDFDVFYEKRKEVLSNHIRALLQ